MKVLERRVVTQQWYDTETNKMGWDSYGWVFDDGRQMGDDWTIVSHLVFTKNYNPIIGIAEREVDISA